MASIRLVPDSVRVCYTIDADLLTDWMVEFDDRPVPVEAVLVAHGPRGVGTVWTYLSISHSDQQGFFDGHRWFSEPPDHGLHDSPEAAVKAVLPVALRTWERRLERLRRAASGD